MVWEKGEIARRLLESLKDRAEIAIVQRVAIGSSYGAVLLNEGRAGLAAVLPYGGCGGGTPGVFRIDGGRWGGLMASQVMTHLTDVGPTLEKTIALATVNALVNNDGWKEVKSHGEIEDLTPRDEVAMVGLFPPLVNMIKETGASLEIIEIDPRRWPVLALDKRRAVLGRCTVAIITATTIINDTLEEVLNALKKCRKVVLLGPSTPMMPAVFRDTPITHLGGSVVVDVEQALLTVSAGGGTGALRPNIRFVTAACKEC